MKDNHKSIKGRKYFLPFIYQYKDMKQNIFKGENILAKRYKSEPTKKTSSHKKSPNKRNRVIDKRKVLAVIIIIAIIIAGYFIVTKINSTDSNGEIRISNAEKKLSSDILILNDLNNEVIEHLDMKNIQLVKAHYKLENLETGIVNLYYKVDDKEIVKVDINIKDKVIEKAEKQENAEEMSLTQIGNNMTRDIKKYFNDNQKRLKPDEGKIFINNSEVVSKDIYKYVQMVYQQPFASFDPVKRIKSGIKEIIKYYNLVPKKEINSYIVYLLQNMELDKKILNHFPHQISGGEAQRIAILKCLLLKPQLLILDESTSMLDVTTQANILSYIKSQVISYGGSIMIISHDYKLLEAYCNKIYNIEEHIWKKINFYQSQSSF